MPRKAGESSRIGLVALIWASLLAHAPTEAAEPHAADSLLTMRTPKPKSGVVPPPPAWASAKPFGQPSPGHLEYTTFTRPSPSYRIYHNLWYHNLRWYAMLPPDQVEERRALMEEGLSANNPVVYMPITDMHNFTKQLRTVFVHGNTLLLDFPFQAYPDHLGHWLEAAVPLYNMLREGTWSQHTHSPSLTLDNVVMPNLSKYFNSWVSNVMAIAWGPGGPAGESGYKPTQIDYADLDETDLLGWVLFQDVVVAQDRYTHPQREVGFLNPEHGDLWRYDGCDRWVSPTFVPSFASPSLGHDFRAAGYRRAKWEPPAPLPPPAGGAAPSPPPLPSQLTLLMPPDDEPSIVNKLALSEMLHNVAAQFGLKARTVSLTADASFASQLDTFATSAVVVGRHAPALASAVFLPPGAAVVELLPFKWEWHKLSMLYFNITQSIGDLHHWAWRPTDVSAARYKEPYAARYKDWFPGECHAKECLQVQAKADIIVDVEAVRQILLAKLPGVLAGRGVQELAESWPEAV